MRKIFFLIALSFLFLNLNAKTDSIPKPIKALNNYIDFTNSSIHGLLIVHRLLENFNQELNRHVDLNSQQFNFYSNADLPANIFIDEEHWFYEVSPYQWYNTAKIESKFLPKEALALNDLLDKQKNILEKINQTRFDLEHLLKNENLDKKEGLDKVYTQLENCVDWYDLFYTQKNEMAVLLAGAAKKYTGKRYHYQVFWNAISEIHGAAKPLMDAIHFSKDEKLGGLKTTLSSRNRQFSKMKKNAGEQLSAAMQKSFDNILAKTSSLVLVMEDYLEKEFLSDNYQHYGKNYYYYNIEAVGKFNRYGEGLVNEMNRVAETYQFPVLKLAEEPHYFKVIYPEKMIDTLDALGQVPIVEIVPTSIEKREVALSQQTMWVDETTFVIEIYDHKKQDGDIISLNFNGKWILEKYKLESKPIKIAIKLNEKGENYLLLHAENLGRNPPNTAAVAYISKGEKRRVVLNSDLNHSEMILIKEEK